MAKCLLPICFIFALLHAASAFIAATQLGWKKCYNSDVSPDKTLEVRFGFPRTEKSNCRMRLQIDFLHTSGDKKGEGKKLHEQDFYCLEMKPREPFVYKHNSVSDEYSGTYQICVQNMEDQNNHNNTLFELQISERFDPSMYAEMGGVQIPLVESTELMQVQETIYKIKKTLSWCQVFMREAQDRGDYLQKLLVEAESTTMRVTYFQIGFLVVYGVFWIVAIRALYEEK